MTVNMAPWNAGARAESALSQLDPAQPRIEWVRIAAAAQAAGVSFEAFHQWSGQAANYKSEEDCLVLWRSLREGGGIGAGTLFMLARKAGWSDTDAAARPQKGPAQSSELNAPRAPSPHPDDVWRRCMPADAGHWYIAAKGAEGAPRDDLRVVAAGDTLRIAGESMAGCLVVPVRRQDRQISSLQFIADKDLAARLKAKNKPTKLNLPGASIDGWHEVGALRPDSVVHVCEGIGGAWACWHATQQPAVVAFGAGRMRVVAEGIRKLYPNVRLVLVPDRGQEAQAWTIAQAVSARVACLPGSWPANADMNDVAVRDGTAAVATLLASASELQPDPSRSRTPDMARWRDARDGTADTEPLTELGNAKRLATAHGSKLNFVPELDSWLVWSDGAYRWSPDATEVRALAAELPQHIYEEGARHVEHGEYFARWARTSQKQQVISAAVQLLRDMPSLRKSALGIDADPWLCGLDSGRLVVDLRTGMERPAKPSDYVTKSLRVASIGDSSKAVRWRAFLAQIFQDNAELEDWIQRWCGYILTGSTREQMLLFAYGHGANGKSVFAELLRDILGDYAKAVAPETLTETKRSAGAATPDLARLAGVRLALTTETEDGAILAESLVKSLTAGDVMSVRPLYRAPFDMLPIFKLLMLGNHKPVIRGTDHGIWRRIVLLPFERTFSATERDTDLSSKLKAEAPHVLAWMVEGCLAWQQRGLAELPRVIAEQTQSYRDEMDTLGLWISECCDRRSDGETSTTTLYASYQAWASTSGIRPMSNLAFGRRLTERGIGVRQSNGVRFRMGLLLARRSA